MATLKLLWVGVLTAVSISLTPAATTTLEAPVVDEIETKETKTVETAGLEVPEILHRIATCESGGRQFNSDGSVVRGKINPLDIGKYQINLYYHSSTARNLGYDLFTEAGNERYALYLLETQGTRPWNWSRSCWSRP